VSPDGLIRAAMPADLPRLAELETLSFPEPWSGALLAAEMAHRGSLLLVAEGAAGEPLRGYACFREGGGEAELLRLAVEPAARRRGLGRQLVAAGLNRLRSAGVGSCHLEVRPANASALAVYRALGFAPAGRRRAYYRDGSDALVLRRDL
jgi:[ribosomal protein S18]-alanine N-acetyltransferase